MSANPAAPAATVELAFELNGQPVRWQVNPLQRLSQLLRERGFTDTKVGCDAGDCGACSVLVDDLPACSCLIAAAQVDGARVRTAAALAETETQRLLRASLLRHGAAQCGICTPGVVVSAVALLEQNPQPDRRAVEDALGGVLCRCTGYARIIDAVLHYRQSAEASPPAAGQAVGSRLPRLDGLAKVDGSERFGADVIPADALMLRLVRSPHHSADFELGDIDAWRAAHPAVVAVFQAADIPGQNRFGVIPPFADQPVFAEQSVRFRGEAIAAVVGSANAIDELDLADFPVRWQPHPEALNPTAALASGARTLHDNRPGNILVRGLVQRGDAATELSAAAHQVTGRYSTPFVEHGYIEPEAGFAVRRGERIELHTCTQTAGMTRDDIALIMGLETDAVRVLPTAVGGGFGSKLDLTIQPYLCLAAWQLNCAVGGIYSRTETMQSTTKRHPSEIEISVACGADGRLAAIDFHGTFNTGAYASWGPTVANRVPVHASGPFYVPHYRARSTAVHTNTAPAGAFRGFGVPQAAIALECSLDQLADQVGIDRLQFRLQNALQNGQPTVTGQVFEQGVGIHDCLLALQPAWRRALADCAAFNRGADTRYRKGCGVATCWYGCGNTSLPNPSTIKIGIAADGRVVLHQGAIDIGQGATTVIAQITADSLGIALAQLEIVGADTDITPDAGKTSASRQTFVTGKAAQLSAAALRQAVLREVNAADDAQLTIGPGQLQVVDRDVVHQIDLQNRHCDADGYVFSACEQYDPPTTALDENGQGAPYAQYGFGAQLMELTVDTELGTVVLERLTSAHDVGRAINPALVEGQIEGGATQGIGMALMEEFIPGVSENLHDYLLPTIGDVPVFEHHIVEVPDAEGPSGAKGLGEHVLIPTAPAILNAIRHATGAEVCDLPATPDKVLAAIRETECDR